MNIHYGSSYSAINTAMSGNTSPEIHNFIHSNLINYQQQTNRVDSNIPLDNFLLDQIQQVTSGNFQRQVDQIKVRLDQSFNINELYYMSSIERIQNSSGNIRDYVVAHPDLYDLACDEKLNLWDNSYIFDAVRIKDLYYEAVDGVVNFKDDSLSYLEVVRFNEEKPKVSSEEKHYIQVMWDVINKSLEESPIDPTSMWGDEIE